MAGPPKDFWCIVALMEFRNPDAAVYDSAPILRMSEDAMLTELFQEQDWFDNGGDRTWCVGKKPGVYKLRLRPWSHGPDMQGEWDTGIDAYEAKLLYEFTDDDLR